MEFPTFNSGVEDNGYRWWYVDAISDDGKNALTVILFVGSVFSPYYAWARNAGTTSAESHCAINVALYGSVNRWTMTERAANSIKRTASLYQIGPSTVRKTGEELIFDIDEIAVPLPNRVTGSIKINIGSINTNPIPIDSAGQHHWQALAPKTEISVEFKKPSIAWRGYAYVDTNFGSTPIENAFASWNWSRAHLANDDTVVQYDVVHRNGDRQSSTLRFNQSGCQDVTSINEQHSFSKTRYWRIPRSTRLQPNTNVSSFRTLEDTPFYARSSYNTMIDGYCAHCIHENINFDRFKQPWVKCLLPFRMPRITKLVKPKYCGETNAPI